MLFREDLPDQCPPKEAVDTSLNKVCRFYLFPEGDPRNFYSHLKLGKNTGPATECRSRSISLFKHDCVPGFLEAKKMAFFKKKKIGILDIPKGKSRSLEGGKGHIDLWPLKDCDPEEHVIMVASTIEEIVEFVKND